MQQICVPSVIMPTACWTAYNTRCPVEAAPEAESYVDLEADYEGGDGGGDACLAVAEEMLRVATAGAESCASNAGSMRPRRRHEEASS